MRRILVTGATGFIGSALVESLANNNYEVWCTTRSEKYLNTDSGVINYISCDLSLLEESIGSFFAAINCAASLRNDCTWKRLSDDNCNSLENLILNIECSKFIQISSCSIFSEKSYYHTQPSPYDYYGLSKYVSEKILEFYSKKFISSFIIRFPIVLGYGKNSNDVIQYIYNKAEQNEEIELFGKGQYYRNIIHVSEAVSAIIKSIEKLEIEGLHHINVGSSNSLRLVELCKIILDRTGSSSSTKLSQKFLYSSR